MFEPYFETGKWIREHRKENDLSNSGLSGIVDLKKYFDKATMMDEEILKQEIADLNGEEIKNVVITHGATEALMLTIWYLKWTNYENYMVRIPEYEPIYKLPGLFNLKNLKEIEKIKEKSDIERGILIYSNINNPTGWFLEELEGFGVNVIDETFLQFSKDLETIKYKNKTFRINTFTKFYGGDDLRVGWIIAPDSNIAEKINAMKGIFTEQVSRYNISVAYHILRDNDTIKTFVKEEMLKNFSYLKKNMGKLKFYNNKIPELSTLSFIDYSEYSNMDSISIANYLYSKGISIVPSKFFGIDGTYLRVCYTRKNFQEIFDKFIFYLEEIG
ncbi:MAG: aminotransferase class I/II-fold pyridoxal phosphate-dependent enzyme [Thermoplasmata archaeon]